MCNKSIYSVAVESNQSKLRQKVHLTVVARSMHEALDLAIKHDETKGLWDKDVQRGIASGKTYYHKDYEGLIEEVDYIGEL